VLHVERREHVDAGSSSSSSTSCQRFGCREPGALVCASSSTSRQPRAALSARIPSRSSSSCSRRRRGARTGCSGSAGSPDEQRRGLAAAVGLDHRRRPRRALGLGRVGPPRAWRRSCRPRARAEEDLEHARALSARACCSRRSSASGSGRAGAWLDCQGCPHRGRLVEQQHVDARLAEHAERPRLDVGRDQGQRPRRSPSRAPRRRARPGSQEQVDELDADEGHDEAAEAVDEEVARSSREAAPTGR
jgi:hypothetical protein